MRLLVVDVLITAYWTALFILVLAARGSSGPGWPFAGVPFAVWGQAWLWRAVLQHVESNESLSAEQRRRWKRNLRWWTPVASLAYLLRRP